MVSAELRSHQGRQSSEAPALTNTAGCGAHFGFRPRREGCPAGLDSPYYLSVSILLLLLAVFSCVKTRSGSAKRLILRRPGFILTSMALLTWASLALLTALLPGQTSGQTGYPVSTRPNSISGTPTATAKKPAFTLPKSAEDGLNILPNLQDPLAVDPQSVCKGYKASNVQDIDNGFTADLRLAGPPCNVYGNDIEDLALLVRFQADDRLRIQIQPRYIGRENQTWFQIPEAIVPRPADGRGSYSATNNMDVSWTNEPSFAFTVKRKDTGDIIFTSEGRALVFEDQFIEFGSSLPENYNLYGLGEVMHDFRLGNDLNSAFCP